MRRLRWVMDSGLWDLDMESPVTMEGTARAVPGDPLPLGLSRGPRISRPKQLDFMHRFMSFPLVPSYAGDPSNGGTGLLFHHANVLHLHENWSVTLLKQFHLPELMSILKERASDSFQERWKSIRENMLNIVSLGFGTELFITHDSSLLLEAYNVKKGTRSKVVFQHKFPQHNFMMEAVSPGLFVDKNGTYWDVPLSMAVDLASVDSGSGLSYHLCLQHNSGEPKRFSGKQTSEAPISLLPGLCAKAAISIKKSIDFWRKKEGKLKLVQPYDALLSNPHVSGLGIIGAAAVGSLVDNSARFSLKDETITQNPFSLRAKKDNLAVMADLFTTVSFSAQHGNFQKLFFDLTRLNARLDITSASTFASGAARLAENIYNSQPLDFQAVRAVCPGLTVSLQQQGRQTDHLDRAWTFWPVFLHAGLQLGWPTACWTRGQVRKKIFAMGTDCTVCPMWTSLGEASLKQKFYLSSRRVGFLGQANSAWIYG